MTVNTPRTMEEWIRQTERDLRQLKGRGHPVPAAGRTVARPISDDLPAGWQYFDTDLGKPIWWSTASAQWVDATGTSV